MLAVATVGAALTKVFHPKAPALYLQNEPLKEDEVTLDLVEAQWEGEVIWIDARSAEEYAEAHHPGALLLNEEGWNDQLWEHHEVIQEGTRPIVVYCATHACDASRRVARRLRENMGLGDVWVLRGGWDALHGAADVP